MDEQGQNPESVKKVWVKAKDACERFVKNGSKHVALPDMSGGVKDAYKILNQHITNLNQLLILGELPSQAAINRNSLEILSGASPKMWKSTTGTPKLQKLGQRLARPSHESNKSHS